MNNQNKAPLEGQCIYSVYDRVANVYAPPMLARTDAEMKRILLAGVKDPRSGNLHTYPGDHVLMRLGTFSVETGAIVPEITPVIVLDLLGYEVNLENGKEG